MGNVVQVPTVQKIKYFKTYYCLGYDQQKVENAEKDLTKLKDVDSSKSWSEHIVACDVKYYKKLNTSESDMRKINSELQFAQELN
jgi:hypothetical protein